MFLAKLHGVRASLGLCDWMSILNYTEQPNGINSIWDRATTKGRKAMLLYLAHALESGVFDIDSSANRQKLVQIWIKALVEIDSQHEAAYLGVALSTNPGTKGLIPVSSDMTSLFDAECIEVQIRCSQHLQNVIEPSFDVLDKLEKVINLLQSSGLIVHRQERIPL